MSKFLDLDGLSYFWNKVKQWVNSTKQDKLVSGTNIKTVNNKSLLGSGNINIQGGGASAFIVEYGVTPYADIKDAYDEDAIIICTVDDSGNTVVLQLAYFDDANNTFCFAQPVSEGSYWVSISSDDTWDDGYFLFASTDTATQLRDGLMSALDWQKLDGIESGAEVNIQSDWNQTTTTADDYIKNKPVIPDGIELLTLDEDEQTLTQEQIALVQSDHCIIVFDGEYYYKNYVENATLEYILNYIDYTYNGICQKYISINTSDGSYSIEKHSLNIQSDWNESDSTSFAYIKNKPTIPTVPVQDVTVGGASVVSNGTAVIPSIPDVSNYVQKSLTAGLLKNDGTVDTTSYGTYSKPSGGIPSTDLASGVIPTVPDISTDIASDASSDTKTASPKAVKTFVENKGYGTYSKPSGGIPASDLASGVIPTVPTISTDIAADKSSTTKTASPSAVYNEVHPATDSSQPSGGMLPNKLYKLGTLSGSVTISLASPTDNTIENEYRFTFTADSTAPTITWPNSVTKWIGNSLDNGAPKVEASTYYEVSIQDGYGIFNAF